MNDRQLDRLRLLEHELILIRERMEAMQVRIYELHSLTVEMLQMELAAPLS